MNRVLTIVRHVCAAILIVTAATFIGVSVSDAYSQITAESAPSTHPRDMQAVSVLVHYADKARGSGFLFTRNVDGVSMSFVWTAAHVAECARQGDTFDDLLIVTQDKRVYPTRVILYSDDAGGHDVALLQVTQRGVFRFDETVHFDLSGKQLDAGDEVYHVGSMRGAPCRNSLTAGIVSFPGRPIDDFEYDQINITAYPGSSGGPLFRKGDGRVVGMVVRVYQGSPGITYTVPARRLVDFAKAEGFGWAVDSAVQMPQTIEPQFRLASSELEWFFNMMLLLELST